jgi:hypothetical protein
MPTGYTYDLLNKNLSFKDFAMLCCRNFGVTITMRDEPFDTQIPEKFEPDNHYKARLDETIEEKNKWAELSFEEKHNFLVTEKQNDLDRKAQSLKEIESQNEKLRNMAVKINRWNPPEKFLCIKNFMLNQIEISIDSTDYYIPKQEEIDYCKGKTPQSYNMLQIEEHEKGLLKDMEYYVKHHIEEIQRTTERNAFLHGLRKSLEDYNEV